MEQADTKVSVNFQQQGAMETKEGVIQLENDRYEEQDLIGQSSISGKSDPRVTRKIQDSESVMEPTLTEVKKGVINSESVIEVKKENIDFESDMKETHTEVKSEEVYSEIVIEHTVIGAKRKLMEYNYDMEQTHTVEDRESLKFDCVTEETVEVKREIEDFVTDKSEIKLELSETAGSNVSTDLNLKQDTSYQAFHADRTCTILQPISSCQIKVEVDQEEEPSHHLPASCKLPLSRNKCIFYSLLSNVEGGFLLLPCSN